MESVAKTTAQASFLATLALEETLLRTISAKQFVETQSWLVQNSAITTRTT